MTGIHLNNIKGQHKKLQWHCRKKSRTSLSHWVTSCVNSMLQSKITKDYRAVLGMKGLESGSSRISWNGFSRWIWRSRIQWGIWDGFKFDSLMVIKVFCLEFMGLDCQGFEGIWICGVPKGERQEVLPIFALWISFCRQVGVPRHAQYHPRGRIEQTRTV